MNRELLDPFQNSFPEIIEETLESGAGATTCAFNRRGSMLATGCTDGRVIIWDFDTRGVAQTLTGHVLGYPVTSVNWSRTGRHLVSSSIDWNVNLYDVLSGSVEASIQMDGQVLYAQLHPRKNNICIVSVHFEDHPYLVDFSTKTKTKLPIPDEEGHDHKKSSKSNSTHGVFAVFNKAGNKVYCGNSRGLIYVIDVKSLKILYSFKVPGGALIKFIQFSKSGKQFLVNSSDRIIRVYEGEDSKTAAREFQDPVNRMQWKKCCFSSDGEFLIGGSAQKSQHNIYIWNREVGPLVKTLEGPKEGIMDLVWHPTRPVIVSLATSGVCYIWGCNYTENWSAFAPDFKELEENEEYNEKEEEFDEIDHTENLKKRKISQEENVDILTTDKVAYWSSDEEDDLVLVPVIIRQDGVAHPP